MQKLEPFQGPLTLGIEAELSLQGPFITIEFQLDLEKQILGLPESSTIWQPKQVPREDELWKTTCFEAFLNPVGQSLYYEFNFSLKPAWNLYVFDAYRSPQPPKVSEEFSLESLIWQQSHNRIKIQLENKTNFSDFNVGLTAIIEDQDRAKHYFSLKHTEQKPDFHAADSFVLQRDNNRGLKK